MLDIRFRLEQDLGVKKINLTKFVVSSMAGIFQRIVNWSWSKFGCGSRDQKHNIDWNRPKDMKHRFVFLYIGISIEFCFLYLTLGPVYEAKNCPWKVSHQVKELSLSTEPKMGPPGIAHGLLVPDFSLEEESNMSNYVFKTFAALQVIPPSKRVTLHPWAPCDVYIKRELQC